MVDSLPLKSGKCSVKWSPLPRKRKLKTVVESITKLRPLPPNAGIFGSAFL